MCSLCNMCCVIQGASLDAKSDRMCRFAQNKEGNNVLQTFTFAARVAPSVAARAREAPWTNNESTARRTHKPWHTRYTAPSGSDEKITEMKSN